METRSINCLRCRGINIQSVLYEPPNVFWFAIMEQGAVQIVCQFRYTIIKWTMKGIVLLFMIT